MKVLGDAFGRACGRFNGSNFDQLNEVDKILITIWSLEGDVNNGGFDQYYFNSAGDLAFYAPVALRSIGAHQMARIVDDANKVFGPTGPSQDRNARQAQLFAINPHDSASSPWDELDRAFFSYPDDIALLLTSFLYEHGRVLE